MQVLERSCILFTSLAGVFVLQQPILFQCMKLVSWPLVKVEYFINLNQPLQPRQIQPDLLGLKVSISLSGF